MRILKKYGDKFLIKELKGSYNCFIRESNLDMDSQGYGLIRDITPGLSIKALENFYNNNGNDRELLNSINMEKFYEK